METRRAIKTKSNQQRAKAEPWDQTNGVNWAHMLFILGVKSGAKSASEQRIFPIGQRRFHIVKVGIAKSCVVQPSGSQSLRGVVWAHLGLGSRRADQDHWQSIWLIENSFAHLAGHIVEVRTGGSKRTTTKSNRSSRPRGNSATTRCAPQTRHNRVATIPMGCPGGPPLSPARGRWPTWVSQGWDVACSRHRWGDMISPRLQKGSGHSSLRPAHVTSPTGGKCWPRSAGFQNSHVQKGWWRQAGPKRAKADQSTRHQNPRHHQRSQ